MADHASLSRRVGWTARMIREAAGQARFPFAAPERIQAVQQRRLRATVHYAHLHVPYYRETMRRLVLGPEELRTAADLARLPLLDREQVQRDPEYFASDEWPPGQCVALASGGTTGEPLTVFRDPPSLLLDAAHRERNRSLIARLAGRRIRYREAHIRPDDSSVASATKAVARTTLLPVATRVQRRTWSMFRPPEEIVEELRGFRPHVVKGYGSYLEELFAFIRHERPRLELPRVATYGADGMSAAMQDWIQGELGIEVLGSYTAIETPQIGFECEAHRGFHLNVDLCPVRLVSPDGDELDEPGPGELVVSNLVNRGTVLLNYRLGDEVTLVERACPCGRTLPMCSYLGRSKLSWLDLGDQQRIHAQELRLVVRRERQIWRYQIVQVRERAIRVRLVAAPDCDREETAMRLRRSFLEQLGGRAEVEIEFVPELPRTGRGKVPPVVSLVDD